MYINETHTDRVPYKYTFIFFISCMFFLFSPPNLLSQDFSSPEVQKRFPSDTKTLSSSVNKTLKLSFIGDIMAHDVNFNMSCYDNIYHSVLDIFKADDLTFANFEFPIHNEKPYSSFPLFNVHSDYAASAFKAGIEAVSLANNHSTDQGKEGINKTLQAIKALSSEYNVLYSGLKENTYSINNAEQKNPNDIQTNVTSEVLFSSDTSALFPISETTIKDTKIGFLALTQWVNVSSGNKQVFKLSYQIPNRKNKLLEYLKTITQKYDVFVLSYHGGIEYSRTPAKDKRIFFNELIQSGVDIVYSHHPHVLQPFEIVEYKKNKKLIIYSMGNFISGQTTLVNPSIPEGKFAYTGDSLILQTELNISENECSISNINPIPITNYRHPKKGFIVKPLKELTEKNLPDVWKQYYNERLAIMENYISRQPIAK